MLSLWHLVGVVEMLSKPRVPLLPPTRRAGRRVAAEVGTSGEATVALLVCPPVGSHANGAQQPEDQVGQVDPDGVLHELDVTVALGVLVDVHLAKDAKDRTPQNENDQAPGRNDCEAQNEGDQIEQRSQRGEGADNYGVDPFAVGIDVSLASSVEILAIEANDDQSHDKLEKV